MLGCVNQSIDVRSHDGENRTLWPLDSCGFVVVKGWAGRGGSNDGGKNTVEKAWLAGQRRYGTFVPTVCRIRVRPDRYA